MWDSHVNKLEKLRFPGKWEMILGKSGSLNCDESEKHNSYTLCDSTTY